MIDLDPNMSVTILNVNHLNIQIKEQIVRNNLKIKMR